jgi:hypothetical protein
LDKKAASRSGLPSVLSKGALHKYLTIYTEVFIVCQYSYASRNSLIVQLSVRDHLELDPIPEVKARSMQGDDVTCKGSQLTKL